MAIINYVVQEGSYVRMEFLMQELEKTIFIALPESRTLTDVDLLWSLTSKMLSSPRQNPKVSNALEEFGPLKEAHFCRLVHNCYIADDKPGIPVDLRIQYHLALRLASR